MYKLYAVGFGTGDRAHMTAEAESAILDADLVVGYTTYVRLMQPLFPEKEFFSTPMRKEIDRCKLAIQEARSGKTVAVISSGDSGIYGMAGVLLELAEAYDDLEVIVVPGITASNAAAAVLGAPLMHDFATISLSDCMTPLELIYRRVALAAEGDFVICLYNPRSKSRADYLARAAELILEHRSPDTPVGIVRHAGRAEQNAWITTLGALHQEPVDMFCIVIIGNSQTYTKNGKIITPRGYRIAGGEQA